MWKTVFAGTAALMIAGSSLVYAQQRSADSPRTRWQPSQEDRAAFAAARVAGLKAGLVLTPEQEKNWPAFEAALKDLTRYRAERAAARGTGEPAANPTERLRRLADTLSGYGGALKKLADAQEPLYNSLDEAQKRRFAVLARSMRDGAMGHHHRGRRTEMGRHRERYGESGRGEHRRWRHRHDDGRRDFGRNDRPRLDRGSAPGEGERL